MPKENLKDRYSQKRKEAEYHESLASDKKNPYHAGNEYLNAAKLRLDAKDNEGALINYKKASQNFNLVAQEAVQNMESHGGGAFASSYLKTVNEASAKALQAKRNIERLEKVTRGEWRGLAGKTSVTISIIGLIGGLFFLSSNFTGNVIGSSTTSNIIGVVLFLVGVVGGFFYFKGKRK